MKPLLPILLLLAGCTVGPDYAPPGDQQLPQAWRQAAAAGSADPAAFWRAFADPVLDELVQRAVYGSPDLGAARARLAAARIRAAAAGSERWPRVDLDASFRQSRLSEHGFVEDFGGGGGAVFPGQELHLYEAGLDASWELDLFGGRRRAVEAGEADADAAAAEARAVLLALVADVADRYLQLRGLQQQLQLQDQRLQSEDQAVLVLQQRAAAGVASELEVADAQREQAAQTARQQALLAAEQSGQYQLERLVGLPPGSLRDELQPAPLPTPPDAFALELPAIVLRRRPDVQAAERRLAAATARVGVATADLYPHIGLGGSFGLQSQDPADLGRYDSRFFAIGPTLRWPLLDFGRAEAAVAAAGAAAEEALLRHRATVLQALADVEVALVRLWRCRQQVLSLERAAAAAATAQRLADEQYRGGVLEYLDFLGARRRRLDADGELLAARAAMDRDVVALAKALGGGFAAADDAAAIRPAAGR